MRRENVVLLVSSVAVLSYAFTASLHAAQVDDVYISNTAGSIFRLDRDTLGVLGGNTIFQNYPGSATLLAVQSDGNLAVAAGTTLMHVHQDTLVDSGFNTIPNASGGATETATGLAILSNGRVVVTFRGGEPSEWFESVDGTTFGAPVDFFGGIGGAGLSTKVTGKLHVDSSDRVTFSVGNGAQRNGFPPTEERTGALGAGFNKSTVRANNDQVVLGRDGQKSELWFLNDVQPFTLGFTRDQIFGNLLDDVTTMESLRGGSNNLMALGTSGGRVGIYDPEANSLLASITGLSSIVGLAVQSDNDIVVFDSAGFATLLRQSGSLLTVVGGPQFLSANLSDIAIQTIPEPASLALLVMGGLLVSRRHRRRD